MKVLVFGGTGMLGHKLVQRFSGQFDTFATIRGSFGDVERFGIFDRDRTLERVDVTSDLSIAETLDSVKPDVVVNAVGVIKQLPTSKDVVTTLSINSIFPHRLAQFAAERGFRLITVGTDCVFDGKKGNYSETDEPNATDLYGKSKSLGEITSERCLTLRTSIIGRELGTAHSLVEWFLSNRGGRVKGFVNAIYSGFPTVVFADIIRDLIVSQPQLSGLYHVSSEPVNKYDLLQMIRSKFDLDIEIERFEDFRIDRSLDSSKFRKETGFEPLPWGVMIERMASDAQPYELWRN